MNALDGKKKVAQRGGGPVLTLDEERELQNLSKRWAAVQKQQKMLDALKKARANAQAQDVQPVAAPAPEQAMPQGNRPPGHPMGTLQPTAADTRSIVNSNCALLFLFLLFKMGNLPKMGFNWLGTTKDARGLLTLPL